LFNEQENCFRKARPLNSDFSKRGEKSKTMKDPNDKSSDEAQQSQEPTDQTNAQGESAAAAVSAETIQPTADESTGKEEIGDDARAAIFAAGQEAGRAGLDPAHCPYSEGDERGVIWRRGHRVGAETRAPEKPEPTAEIDEAARIPDRFRSLVVGRMVYYADRINSDQVGELPAIVTSVVSQAQGTVNLQVIRNDQGGLMFTKNVSYDVRKTWRWPQGE
jgi:hypothetical protein